MTLEAKGAYWSDSHLALYVGNCLHMDAIPDGSVHCVVTSPPYLSKRKYRTEPLDWPDGWRGHLGLEPSPEMFIGHLIEIFREVKRVLRPDGVVWINIGDTHWGGKGQSAQAWSTEHLDRETLECEHHQISGYGETRPVDGKHDILHPGDLIGIPWRFALAMQQDGWHLRQDIIWQKPAPMPESVNGVRWEKHRVKVGSVKDETYTAKRNREGEGKGTGWSPAHPEKGQAPTIAQWADCPGCPECAPNDGLVLRRGIWRPTASHEYIFMFAKSDHYYADREAVKEESICTSFGSPQKDTSIGHGLGSGNSGINKAKELAKDNGGFSGRNKRSVWTIGPEPCKLAHFAVYPTELPTICIKASTSEAGVCPKCGSQWARVLKVKPNGFNIRIGDAKYRGVTAEEGYKTSDIEIENYNLRRGSEDPNETETLGWRATCKCGETTTVPATILDPFAGTFTTGLAAKRLGRRAIGYELSAEYAELAIDRNRQAGLL